MGPVPTLILVARAVIVVLPAPLSIAFVSSVKSGAVSATSPPAVATAVVAVLVPISSAVPSVSENLPPLVVKLASLPIALPV